jgi:hypothetical protein
MYHHRKLEKEEQINSKVSKVKENNIIDENNETDKIN